MDKKCMYCMHISQFFDSCELPWECKYESNFIAKRFIEELENIKEKIDIECDSVDLALDVILDRIKELKGEADGK